MAVPSDVVPHDQPLAVLEREIINAFIRGAGYDPAELRTRSDETAKKVLALATEFASARLSEVEARLHYLRSLKGEE